MTLMNYSIAKASRTADLCGDHAIRTSKHQALLPNSGVHQRNPQLGSSSELQE